MHCVVEMAQTISCLEILKREQCKPFSIRLRFGLSQSKRGCDNLKTSGAFRTQNIFHSCFWLEEVEESWHDNRRQNPQKKKQKQRKFQQTVAKRWATLYHERERVRKRFKSKSEFKAKQQLNWWTRAHIIVWLKMHGRWDRIASEAENRQRHQRRWSCR